MLFHLNAVAKCDKIDAKKIKSRTKYLESVKIYLLYFVFAHMFESLKLNQAIRAMQIKNKNFISTNYKIVLYTIIDHIIILLLLFDCMKLTFYDFLREN